MALEVRPCSSREEFVAAASPIFQYFGGDPSEDWVNDWLRVFEVGRMHAALEDGQTVGGAGAFSLELAVPGGRAPAAGVTVVGVLPTNRRRGVLTRMMRAQLDTVHERGEPLAALWASEAPIYGRYGYGLASLQAEIDVPRERTGFADRREASGGGARLVSEDEALALFPTVYDAVYAIRPGMNARSRDWWETRRLADPEARRGGGGPQKRVVIERDSRPEAYALYRIHSGWEHFSSTGHVNVIEAVGSSPESTRELWRFLFDIDWMARVKAGLLPVDHPLLLLVAEPRRLGFRIGDALWLRLVDVGAALGARSYDGDEPVTFEVSDSFCGWNEGRWKLEGGEAARTTATAHLRLDVSALGSVYLGGFTFAQLSAAGLVEELAEGACASADRLFRTERAPWCPEIF